MRTFLLLLAIAGVSVVSSIAADKPNIVFFLADDLGYGELGCYGQEKIRTPHIDALAREGMLFTQAYAGNAVCAPSRCVLMTSKHPGHATVRSNLRMEPEGQYPIGDAEITLAERLQGLGYVCGAFGKWGLGNVWSEGNPNKQGFHRFFGYNCQGKAHTYYPESLWSDSEVFPLKNNPPIPGHEGLDPGANPMDPASYNKFKGQDWAPDRIHEQAVAFLKANKAKPFFLFYPSILPHVALQIPDAELEPYLEMKWNDPPFTREAKGYGYTPHFTPRAAYAAMISKLDKQVGDIVGLLDKMGLKENTIVIFASDNGPTHINDEVDVEFFNSAAGYRGLKGDLYEGGIRIPQVIRWPGKIAAGSTSDHVTGFEDWAPTFMELIGGPAPEDIDGVSFAPTLLGEKQEARPYLYREFPGYGGQQAVWLDAQWKGVRTKLISLGKKGATEIPTELYDLKTDPKETKDVSADHPELVKQIEEIMKREHVASKEFPIPILDQ